ARPGGPAAREGFGLEDRDVRARQEEPLLVRVSVDREVHEVGANSAVVEERVPLAGSTVAGDGAAVAPRSNQEVEQCTLGFLDAFAKARVGLERAVPRGVLPFAELLDPISRRVGASLETRIEPKRAAVRGELLDVEDAQPVGREDLAGRAEREVREERGEEGGDG